jgi:hypothetical protein
MTVSDTTFRFYSPLTRALRRLRRPRPMEVSQEAGPLPENLIALGGEEGHALLAEADARASLVPLMMHFTTQRSPVSCGPATMAMLLNALGLPRPPVARVPGRRMFDQDNVFSPEVEAVVTRRHVERKGMSLRQFGGALGAHAIDVDVRHAEHSTLEAFREAAVACPGRTGRFVIANYERSILGQERCGHISPLGAYHAASDRFLVLDVARYRYPPVWVRASELFAAMNTRPVDMTRGYVLVGRG